uniref:Uncharacterized protein n=1 Tax=Steinernema glaseri TaxID=37863 RepID=A0A1I7Y989_9BILA
MTTAMKQRMWNASAIYEVIIIDRLVNQGPRRNDICFLQNNLRKWPPCCPCAAELVYGGRAMASYCYRNLVFYLLRGFHME